jgi:signal peptidase I
MAEKFSDLSQSEQPQKRPYEEWFYWLQTMVTAIICIILIFTFFGRVTRVVGHSMDPTLSEGELLLVWSLGYEPQAGDIVVCNKDSVITNTLLHGDAIIKRVIATEGQTVDIDYENSVVYVDGQPLEEDYILEDMYLPGLSEMQGTHFQVPEGSVFLMGDNRNGSTDSRHVNLGTVDTRYLLGKAVFVFFPFNRFGLL